MTLIHERDPHPLKMYPQAKNELSRSRLSKVIELYTFRQTDRQTDATETLPQKATGMTEMTASLYNRAGS